MVAFLRRHDIHPTFVLEGIAPVEKHDTQVERKLQRQKIVEKTDSLQKDLHEYILTGKLSSLLQDTAAKISGSKPRTLLTRKPVVTFQVKQIEEEIARRRRNEFSITTEDVALLRELLLILGVGCIQAVGEAETTCVDLFFSGHVDYIAAEDSDVLAYCAYDGAVANPDDLKIVTQFDFNNDTCTLLSKRAVVETLGMTHEQFRDFCIMCGTDYNKNIFKIGVEKSYKFISECKTIENVKLDTSILKYERSRELFTSKPNTMECCWTQFPLNYLEFADSLNMFAFRAGVFGIDAARVYKDLTETEIDSEQRVKARKSTK
jgi:5'-3' exonuclease